MSPFTTETFGPLNIRQYQTGYRFSIDPFLLAHHVALHPGERILDLGTGCGIIPLLLALRNPHIRLLAAEIQPDLAELARHNIQMNGMQETIEVFGTDMRLLHQDQLRGPVDIITINPPYHKRHSGRINPHSQKAAARHEIHIELNEWLLTSRRLLKTGGRLHAIFPSERSAELIAAMTAHQLIPKRLRTVHATCGAPARLVLVEAVLAARPGLIFSAPLILYHSRGVYTEEALQILYPPEFFPSAPEKRNPFSPASLETGT